MAKPSPAVLAGLALALLTPHAPGQRPQRGGDCEPATAVHSVLEAPEVPPDHVEPSAEELAAKVGLVRADESGPDGTPYWRHDPTGMLFVFVPGGTFQMGSNYSDIYLRQRVLASAAAASLPPAYFESEQPQGEVYVSSFFIGVYEVTVGQFRQFLKPAADHKVGEFHYPPTPPKFDHTPFQWNADIPFWDDEQPVVGISWPTCYAMSRWMGGRLPTEAEWEKAARGTDGRIFPWGNRFDNMRCNTSESLNGRTMPVGTFPGGRSPYGCYDMTGNVAEYVMDAYERSIYRRIFPRPGSEGGPPKDPCLLELNDSMLSPMRVVRGGNWTKRGFLAKARTTGRGRLPMHIRYSSGGGYPAIQYLHSGFRVVMSEVADLFPPEWSERMLWRREQAGEENPAGEEGLAGEDEGK